MRYEAYRNLKSRVDVGKNLCHKSGRLCLERVKVPFEADTEGRLWILFKAAVKEL